MNLKKVICMILASALLFLLASCGAKSPTKEEMVSQAKEVDGLDINNTSVDNLSKAKSEYCNQILSITDTVYAIKENYIEIGGGTYFIDIYLPTEDLILLEKGQQICVVGQITDEIIEDSKNAAGTTINTWHYQMPVAYLVADTFEFEGVLKGVNDDYKPAFNIENSEIENSESDYKSLVYFKDGVNISGFEYGDKIKFKSKQIWSYSFWSESTMVIYKDAEIVE